MIAGEHYNEHWIRRVVRQLMNRSIDARKLEVWRRRSECEDWMWLLRPSSQRKRKKGEDSPQSSH